MKHFTPYLIGCGLTGALDAIWWFAANSMLQIGVPDDVTQDVRLVPADSYYPTFLIPWLCIGVFVMLAGLTRKSSAVPRLWVALGALTATLAALAFLVLPPIMHGYPL